MKEKMNKRLEKTLHILSMILGCIGITGIIMHTDNGTLENKIALYIFISFCFIAAILRIILLKYGNLEWKIER